MKQHHHPSERLPTHRVGRRPIGRRATRWLAPVLALSVVAAPMVAHAGAIGSQTRRAGTVAENRGRASEVQTRVAREIATAMLKEHGIDEARAREAVARLAPDEVALVAYASTDGATVRATHNGRAIGRAFLFIFLFWLFLICE